MSWIMRSITTVSFCTRGTNGPRRRDSIRMGDDTICLSSSTAPLKRSTWPTCRMAPARWATANSSRASSSVGVMGFSTSTLMPASSRSRATWKCCSVGTATLATSTRPIRSRWSLKACGLVAGGHRLRPLAVDVDHAHQLDVGQLGVDQDVVLPHVAGPHHPGPQPLTVGHQALTSSESDADPARACAARRRSRDGSRSR